MTMTLYLLEATLPSRVEVAAISSQKRGFGSFPINDYPPQSNTDGHISN